MKFHVLLISTLLFSSFLFSVKAQDSLVYLTDETGAQLVDEDGDYITFLPQRYFSLNVTGQTGNFTLGSDAPANIIIYWGDGSSQDYLINGETTIYYNYASVGIYDIYISGDIDALTALGVSTPHTRLYGTISNRLLEFENLKSLEIYNAYPYNTGFVPVDFDSLTELEVTGTSTSSYAINYNDLLNKDNLSSLVISYGNENSVGDLTQVLDKNYTNVIITSTPASFSIDSLYKSDSINHLNLEFSNASGTIDERFNDVMKTMDAVRFRSTNVTGALNTYMPNIQYINNISSQVFINFDSIANSVLRYVVGAPGYCKGSLNSFTGDKSFFGSYFYVYDSISGTLDSIYDWNVSNGLVINSQFVGGNISVFENPGLQTISVNLSIISPVKGDLGVFDFYTGHALTIGSDSVFTGLSKLGNLPYTEKLTINCNLPVSEINSYFDSLFFYRNNYNLTVNKIFATYSNNGTPSGTLQQGDLGTYAGSVHDLTETQLDNLAAGNNYDGAGTNTPWTPLEKVWALVNIKESSASSTARYKFSITY